MDKTRTRRTTRKIPKLGYVQIPFRRLQIGAMREYLNKFEQSDVDEMIFVSATGVQLFTFYKGKNEHTL